MRMQPVTAPSAHATSRLVAYFGLAFAVTWLSILAFVASRGFEFAGITAADGLVIFLLMCAGPFTAGLVMTVRDGGHAGLRELGSRIRRWRARPAAWATALLTSPLVTLSVLLFLAATVSSAFTPEARVAGLAIGLLAGTLEEVGWTGYATPRLLERATPLRAGLVLGLIWALWHGFADYTGNIATKGFEGWVVWFVTYWLIPLTGYRVLMTLVYSRTGSVLLAMLMHASWTGWQFFLSPAATTQAQDAVWHLLLAAGIWSVVAVAWFRMRSTARLERPVRMTPVRSR
jgi:membrane protease YdiL (CAAX protease family)